MPSDYKPFQPAFWDIRDWHTLEELTEWFVFASTTPLEPGQELLVGTITVPEGVKYHYSENFYSTQFDGAVWLYVPAAAYKTTGYLSKNTVYSLSYRIPNIFPPGMVGYVYVRNDDIIPGHWDIEGAVYKIPLSPMPKPKSDDPEEIKRVGDFNFRLGTILPDGNYLEIFRKVSENRAHFLRTENFGKPEQKIIAKGHLSLKDLDLIMRNLREKPEKAIKILEKFEKGKAKTK